MTIEEPWDLNSYNEDLSDEGDAVLEAEEPSARFRLLWLNFPGTPGWRKEQVVRCTRGARPCERELAAHFSRTKADGPGLVAIKGDGGQYTTALELGSADAFNSIATVNCPKHGPAEFEVSSLVLGQSDLLV